MSWTPLAWTPIDSASLEISRGVWRHCAAVAAVEDGKTCVFFFTWAGKGAVGSPVRIEVGGPSNEFFVEAVYDAAREAVRNWMQLLGVRHHPRFGDLTR